MLFIEARPTPDNDDDDWSVSSSGSGGAADKDDVVSGSSGKVASNVVVDQTDATNLNES